MIIFYCIYVYTVMQRPFFRAAFGPASKGSGLPNPALRTGAFGQKRSVGAEIGRGSLGAKLGWPGRQGCIATRLRPWQASIRGPLADVDGDRMLTDALIVA